jgi:plastocyanin
MLIRTAALTLAAAGALALAGCGDSGSSSTSADTTMEALKTTSAPPATATKVRIKDFMYGPPSITVAPGAKVTWTNEDSAPHTATVKGGFDTDSITQGKSASVTLTKPGTYAYYCAFHPYMKGTVVVKG